MNRDFFGTESLALSSALHSTDLQLIMPLVRLTI